jgi:hypothetical protein
MSKFDEMISKQGVPSYKEKKVEMPSIKAIVNYGVWAIILEEEEEEDVVDYCIKF